MLADSAKSRCVAVVNECNQQSYFLAQDQKRQQEKHCNDS